MSFPRLTLDSTTLFYFNLSNDAQCDGAPQSQAIDAWIDGVTPHSKQKTKRSAGSMPSLTLSKTSAPTESVLTRSAIQASVNVNVVTDSQGLSDVDETVGEERKLAHESPVKGKRRVNSEVFFFFLHVYPQFTSPYLGNRQGQGQERESDQWAEEEPCAVVWSSFPIDGCNIALPLGRRSKWSLAIWG